MSSISKVEHVVRLSVESLSAEIKKAFRKNGITEESLKISPDLTPRNSTLESASKFWLDWQKKLLGNPFQEIKNVATNVIGLQISTDAEKSLSPDGKFIKYHVHKKTNDRF